MSRKSFLECTSTSILQTLSLSPLDLTAPGVLSDERIRQFSLESEGFLFSFATERLDHAVLAALTSLAEERGLHESMESMQQGGIVNYIEGYPSESLPALHTATRAWVLETSLTGIAEETAVKSRIEAQRLQSFLEKAREKFSTIIQIGIGGSELGPKALYWALKGYCPSDKHVHFVSNIDPDNATEVLQSIDCKKTLVVTVSKSGTTLETKVNEEFLAEYFAQKGLPFKEHFVSVTCAGSALDDSDKYLEVFHIWESIGGRYSSTSMVGGVVLGFAFGFEVFLQVLQGAAAMDRAALQPRLLENLPMLSAMIGIWNRNFLRYPTVAVIPYAYGLEYFPAHLQQCIMESNGKSITTKGERVGFATSPVVWGEPGTNCQHSFFQWLHQGSDIVPVEFLGFLKSQRNCDITVMGSSSSQKLLANMIAQAIALAKGRSSENPNRNFDGNRPSSLLITEKLTPYVLGGLLAYYEHKTVFQGFCWGINPFDQEGVSLGKELSEKVLKVMKGEKVSGEFPEIEALLALLDKK